MTAIARSLRNKIKRYDYMKAIVCWNDSLLSYVDSFKTNIIMEFLSDELSPVIEKYKDKKLSSDKIGNKVWVFWYTGFESAPPVVRACMERIKRLKDADVVFLDKYNLFDYVRLSEQQLDGFENGRISIQTLSDIIRFKLLSEYGGFWVDATIYFNDLEFVKKLEGRSFYSLKHIERKACLHFSGGRWSSFFLGAPKSDCYCSMICEFYDLYYSKFDRAIDYFLTDYLILLMYENVKDFKSVIDGLPCDHSDAFFLWKHFYRKYDSSQWDIIRKNNPVQKTVWKIKDKYSTDCYLNKLLSDEL